jgi:hypothetical protein
LCAWSEAFVFCKKVAIYGGLWVVNVGVLSWFFDFEVDLWLFGVCFVKVFVIVGVFCVGGR